MAQERTPFDAPQIFITGATGYIGGEALHAIVSDPEHSKAVITCLVRDQQKADIIRKAYPKVHILLGDLDDADKIQQQAAASDIVLNMASTRHSKSAQAIAKGLSESRSAGSSSPAYWIQVLGGTLFAGNEISAKRFGEHSDEVWDDVSDVGKTKDVMRDSPARETDRLVLSSAGDSVKTAFVVGPLIYGHGNGPVNKRSIQAPDIAKRILRDGSGFKFNAGQNRWSTIHIADLGHLLNLLVKSTTAADEAGNLWNDNGFYFPETGIATFGDLCQSITSESHKQGFIKSGDIERTIDATEADEVAPHGSILLGTNSISTFSRAKSVPGWRKEAPSLQDTIPELVRLEAKALGL